MHAGYPTDLRKLTWPVTGSSVYKGKGWIYYIQNKKYFSVNANNKFAYALYTADVTVTVDYAGKLLNVLVGPDPQRIEAIGDQAGSLPGYGSVADIRYQGFSYATLAMPSTTYVNGLNLTGSGFHRGVESIQFFGARAEEISGLFTYNGKSMSPVETDIKQIISFTLPKV